MVFRPHAHLIYRHRMLERQPMSVRLCRLLRHCPHRHWYHDLHLKSEHTVVARKEVTQGRCLLCWFLGAKLAPPPMLEAAVDDSVLKHVSQTRSGLRF